MDCEECWFDGLILQIYVDVEELQIAVALKILSVNAQQLSLVLNWLRNKWYLISRSSWQNLAAFRRRQKWPQKLSSGAYLLFVTNASFLHVIAILQI